VSDGEEPDEGEARDLRDGEDTAGRSRVGGHLQGEQGEEEGGERDLARPATRARPPLAAAQKT